MLLQIPDVLDASQVTRCRDALAAADWADGRATAGYQSARANSASWCSARCNAMRCSSRRPCR